MLEVEEVIGLILLPGYFNADQVTIAKETEDNIAPLHENAVLPDITVGYATIMSRDPNKVLENNVFNTGGENLVQYFDIRTVCKPVDLRTNWVQLYKALLGQNPRAAERKNTGFTYVQGGKMGLSNGNIWWVDRWGIGFPKLTKF